MVVVLAVVNGTSQSSLPPPPPPPPPAAAAAAPLPPLPCAQVLVRKLLEFTPQSRLGNLRGGVGDIQKQRWYSEVDFERYLAKQVLRRRGEGGSEGSRVLFRQSRADSVLTPSVAVHRMPCHPCPAYLG